MKRLIDANAAADNIMKEVEDHACEIGIGAVAILTAFARALRDETEFPTIEQEVRHGEWHECWHTDTVCASICTNCGKAATQARVIVGQELMTNVRYPLCPNCGARMDGGEG